MMAGGSGGDQVRPRLRMQLSETEFTCSICYELLVLPTTLTCGHNFCRLCLANWLLSSRQQKCPVCQQLWLGRPKVNLLLSSTVEQLFPERIAQLKEDILTTDALSKIKTFENSVDRERVNQPGRRGNLWQYNTFLGVAIGIVAILIFSYVWDILFRTSDALSERPVSRWTQSEVTQWLEEVGPWAADALTDKFTENHIDGKQVLLLSETDIDGFGDLSTLQRKALRMELYSLREHGMKAPTSFEEYRDRHLSRTALYTQGMTKFPRVFILYAMMADYPDVFLPCLHVAEPVLDHLAEVNLYTYQLPAPTIQQWLLFLVKWLLFPYVPVIQMARHVCSPFLAFTFSLQCLALTVTDVLSLYAFVTTAYRLQNRSAVTKGVVHFWLIFLLSQLTPSFLLRFFVNVKIFVMPYVYSYWAVNALSAAR